MGIRLGKRIGPFVAFGLALALAACARSDTRLNDLTKGITRDSMMSVMGMNEPRRIDRFLINGQNIEALYFARPGAQPEDSIPDRELSPVILVDGTLAGWGWKEWDSIAAANKIVLTKE